MHFRSSLSRVVQSSMYSKRPNIIHYSWYLRTHPAMRKHRYLPTHYLTNHQCLHLPLENAPYSQLTADRKHDRIPSYTHGLLFSRSFTNNSLCLHSSFRQIIRDAMIISSLSRCGHVAVTALSRSSYSHASSMNTTAYHMSRLELVVTVFRTA